MAYKYSVFMQGRNGNDEFSRFLTIAALVFMVLSWIKPLSFMALIAFVLLVWTIFRCYSKNLAKRGRENEKYIGIKSAITGRFTLYKNMFRDRKTHRYYKCPGCKVYVRIPKLEHGKNIEVSCKKCGKKFVVKT